MPNPLGVLLRNRHAGQDTMLWAHTDAEAPAVLELTSDAFAHGEPIPRRYRGRIRGENVSPPLSWAGVPDGTVELVLVAQDPDAPGRRAAVHVLARGIEPGSTGLPEGALRAANDALVFGRGPLGRRGWLGPMPVPSHGPHAYVFQLYALDRALDLADGFTLDALRTAMPGHLLARGRLDGSYEIP